jgi:hypothetical protein
VLALVLAVPSIGEAKAEKPWRLGKATVTDEQMTLPLPGSDIREVDAARVHRSGQKRISVFFPDIRGRRMMKRYKKACPNVRAEQWLLDASRWIVDACMARTAGQGTLSGAFPVQ